MNVIQPFLRGAFAVALSFAMLALVLPGSANVSTHDQHPCCCERAQKEANHGDCNDQPAKPAPDRQCCVGCPLTFALLGGESKLLVFAPIDRERFPLIDFSQQSRTDRPPVPPPRLSLIA